MGGLEQPRAVEARRLGHQDQPLAAARIGQRDDGVAISGSAVDGDALGDRERDHLAAELGKALGAADDRDETLVVDGDDVAGVVPSVGRRRRSRSPRK